MLVVVVILVPGDVFSVPVAVRSAVSSREVYWVLYEKIGFKNSGLMAEFRSLVGIGRSGVMIGRLHLNMGS